MATRSRSDDTRTNRSALTPAGSFELTVVRNGAASIYAIPLQGQLSIGRSKDADVYLEGSRVSRHHAILHVQDGAFELEDLGSANGTYLQQVRLAPVTRHPLEPGVTAQIGDYSLLVGPSFQHTEASGPSLIAESPGMKAVLEQVSRVAIADLGVLLLGETGVGKDVIAARLHELSGRRRQPFLRINCAALTDTLLESELFGHERGAFTGAVQAKPGLLESAGRGTVFLDEIGELPARLQPKLLHALETRQVTRVGGVNERPIEARFVAATNRDLAAEIVTGGFRSDLYYRLAGFVLKVPPLRDRIEDVLPLARHFLRTAARRSGLVVTPTIDESAESALMSHRWPGNIRELRNVIERAMVMTRGRRITLEELALGEASTPKLTGVPGAAADERARIIKALIDAQGNQTQAARLLGMSRGTLLTRLDAYQIARPRKRPLAPS